MQRTRPSAIGFFVYLRPTTNATRQAAITPAPMYQYAISTVSSVRASTTIVTTARTASTTAVMSACSSAWRLDRFAAVAGRDPRLRSAALSRSADRVPAASAAVATAPNVTIASPPMRSLRVTRTEPESPRRDTVDGYDGRDGADGAADDPVDGGGQSHCGERRHSTVTVFRPRARRRDPARRSARPRPSRSRDTPAAGAHRAAPRAPPGHRWTRSCRIYLSPLR